MAIKSLLIRDCIEKHEEKHNKIHGDAKQSPVQQSLYGTGFTSRDLRVIAFSQFETK